MHILFSHKGKHLSTRIDGEFFRREIEQAIERGERVQLDFDGVEVVSNSFADECFAKLIFSFDLFHVKEYTTFVNASPFIKAVIANSFKERLQAVHA